MKRLLLFSFFILSLLVISINSVQAEDCLHDPIYERDWNAVVTTGARFRSIPCMETSEVMSTLPVGEVVKVIAETDGWYQVKRSDGSEGWVGQWLIEKTDAQYYDKAPMYDTKGHRYETAMNYLYKKGIIQGYADNTFRPENSINRAEFTKILVEATQDNFEDKKESYQRSCFSDVPANQWYTPYVCFARGKKILGGYPDGSFHPSADINLVEALKIIVNVFEIPKGDEGENWYAEYLNGMGDKKYIPATFASPSQKVARAEMAEMVWRVLEKKSDQDYRKSDDLLNSACQFLPENIPSNIDMDTVRATWLDWYNTARVKEGKIPYVYNDQLNRSAVIWSEDAKTKGKIEHKRPGQTEYYDFNMLTDWFADLGITFKNVGGYVHTENIGWGVYNCYDDDCTEELIDGIRLTFDFFMGEEGQAYAPHWSSVMNDYFREIGLGIAIDNGKYYLTVHYGAEVISDELPICE